MDINTLLYEYDNILVMDGNSFLQRIHNSFDTNIPLFIYNAYDLDACKKKIQKVFGSCEIEIAGNEIFVKNAPFLERTSYSFGDLVEIIFRLRDEDGCQWDRAQNNMSIRTNAIEEAYELIEAVELNDNSKMREEFGDVLLQGIFNAVIAEQEKRFTHNDVITSLCQKLINRHTHIFGQDKANNKEEALRCWEKAKAKEKEQKTVRDKIESVPYTFTALLRAYKVQKIIKKTGFDFPTLDDAVNKIYEEINEFISSAEKDKEKEAGDMLFSVVNVLRMSNIDPELALNGTTNRFIRRFEYVIEKAEEQGKKVEELSLEEMEKYYCEYKGMEKNYK